MQGFFDNQIIPIPDCTELIALVGRKRGITSPSGIASQMLREARLWQARHPNRDIMEIITPDWREYIKQNL